MPSLSGQMIPTSSSIRSHARAPTAATALVSYRDERGRELLDLADLTLPDVDRPVPVRFLPCFDNAVLGYDDRSRIIDDEHRGLSVAAARFVLIEGRVAGTWSWPRGDDGVVSIEIEPLCRWSRAERAAVSDEAERLAAFLSDGATGRVRIE